MFVHLRLHSEFSITDGANRIDGAVAAAAADGQPALALTDLNNLFGAIKFYQTARGAGVKPVLGAEVMLEAAAGAAAPVFSSSPDKDAASRVLLLAQNHQGYLNLCELLTRAWTQSASKTQALARWAWLEELADGLILLSGGSAGPVGQALAQGDAARASDLALRLAQAFPHRCYLELQRAGRAGDEPLVAATVQLAARLKLPVVATHPVQFASAEDYEAHEARVCIAEGEILANPRRTRRFTPDQYFKPAAEMARLFADVPSAIANTVEIARRCNVTLTLGKPRLPEFPVPDGYSIESYFRHAAQQGLEKRLAHLYPDAAERERQRPLYQQRLEFEIDTILKMGFPGYFLIVGDFITWAKTHGCPVGPGRGSGAGSLAAYALEITDLDPLRYKLLFERFLNPERVSMPDFDIDFCFERRGEVIDYVKEKYTNEKVAQIVTFGTLQAKAAIKDVARALEISIEESERITKFMYDASLDEALDAVPELRRISEE
ncbi:MAG: DNA polymerase III subunit alpha, partial [Burkholderiaceae bacterium]|nr:DNA polymerase III subunit alpha [Burkholderiaceae bacterium]